MWMPGAVQYIFILLILVRAVQHPMGRGGGALEASRDMETGQVASRAVPILEPMVEQGSRAVMADPGTRATTEDQGTWAAMADLGNTWAMAGQGSWAAMTDQGPPLAMVVSPP